MNLPGPSGGCLQMFHYKEPIKSIYIIGSLRNQNIPVFANELQTQGFEAFADWYQPGPDADDFWRDYSKARGRTYKEALESPGANQIFDFDKHHLDRCDAAVMLMPAGKSGHLELGYTIGRGKPGFILFDGEPERYEVMVKFATRIFFNKEDLFKELKRYGIQTQFEKVAAGQSTIRSTKEVLGQSYAD